MQGLKILKNTHKALKSANSGWILWERCRSRTSPTCPWARMACGFPVRYESDDPLSSDTGTPRRRQTDRHLKHHTRAESSCRFPSEQSCSKEKVPRILRRPAIRLHPRPFFLASTYGFRGTLEPVGETTFPGGQQKHGHARASRPAGSPELKPERNHWLKLESWMGC